MIRFFLPLILMFNHPLMEENILTITDGTTIISTVNRNDFRSQYNLLPIVDEIKYKKLADSLNNRIYQEPVNARIAANGTIVVEKLGVALHEKKFRDLFYTYFFKKGPATKTIPKLTLYPKVDRDLLERIHVKLIGHYVTFYRESNSERSHNIALSVQAIDSHVLFPGEVFSFNKTVGKRTAARGYLPAPIIVRGELSEGIGGGICQVSTTLFNAVDRAGLKIEKRYSHSKRVPYVLPGRDATVSWYGPDFTFKNIYDEPILIRAKAEYGRVLITVFSSDEINYQPRTVPSISRRK